MRAFGLKRELLILFCVGILVMCLFPGHLLADDKDSNNPPAKAEAAKPAPAKFVAPAPGLTEREQWLLDRVEQLERRVAELESKGAP